MKLISFLVTAYNLEEWMLKRCIDSLIAQNMPATDYEIIVVDDGSEHSPEPVMREYPDAPIVFHRQHNGGPGAARNTALSLASGRYCFFVDGDDFLFADSLSPLVGCLRSETPDILQIEFRHVSEYTSGACIPPPIRYKTYPSGACYMLTNNLSGCNWLYLFKRNLVQQHALRYPEKILHEDEEFITRLFLAAGKVIKTNYPVYAYWFRPDSIVNNPSPGQLKRRIDDFLTVIAHLQQYEHQTHPLGIRAKALRRKICYMGVDFLLKTLRADTADLWFEESLPRLKELNLYPLPLRPEASYFIFSQLIQWRSGRRLLRYVDGRRSKKF